VIIQELGRRLEKEMEGIEGEYNENEPPTIDDVRKAIHKLKNNRSPVPDNIIAELVKTKQCCLLYCVLLLFSCFSLLYSLIIVVLPHDF
jgi:hypothetical protein